MSDSEALRASGSRRLAAGDEDRSERFESSRLGL